MVFLTLTLYPCPQVFHVCAFTDDGLVMKSFLCPESTLFDQTILKCNWWFYVDCKSSKKLYDSNIPISKSYQLMKALAFFSSYRNQSSNATWGTAHWEYLCFHIVKLAQSVRRPFIDQLVPRNLLYMYWY